VPLAILVKRFAPDIAARIVGTTPAFKIHDACDVPAVVIVRFWRTWMAAAPTGGLWMTTSACFHRAAPNWFCVMMVFEITKNGRCVQRWTGFYH
jgi:hypothetical protein